MDYIALQERIIAAKLLDRQYGYYAFKIATTASLLVLSIFFLAKVENFALQLLNAAFLAFVLVQVAMLMHDAGHRMIFNSSWKNDLVGLITGNLILYISFDSWKKVHNRHHISPNVIDHDPDIDVLILAHSEEQALRKRGIARFIVKHQTYLWFPIVSLVGFIIRINHFRQLLLKFAHDRANVKYHIIEALLLATGYMMYFGLIFHFLNGEKAVAFILTNYLLMGTYMSTVFATNHKGMPIMKEKLDFLRIQVITARDVKSNPVVDFWCGGLNYQIEHHLFSTMPRNNLSKAKKIVKAFCKEYNIMHYETGFFQSYKEIVQHIRRVSDVLNKTDAHKRVTNPTPS